jgi:hypothetical protein
LDLAIKGGDSLGIEFGIVEILKFGVTVFPPLGHLGFPFHTLSYACLL